MVVVAYRRWSFTRGSNCKALAGKRLVFWIGGHLWEAVAYKRWSHVEVQLYFIITGVKKIICYTKDFNYRTSLYQSSTVIGRNLRANNFLWFEKLSNCKYHFINPLNFNTYLFPIYIIKQIPSSTEKPSLLSEWSALTSKQSIFLRAWLTKKI